MYNQIIIDDIYDENNQPPDEDILEYAAYIGINTKEEPELMWIARQGVKAPLPKGWKAIHDLEKNELYYFNFDTGESIWDHPCDNDYKNLVIEQRKILFEKGRENYKPPSGDTLTRQPSPTKQTKSPADTLRGTTKSTSTISELVNGANKRSESQSRQNIRGDYELYDTRDLANVEYEEEEEEEEENDEDKQRDDYADENNRFDKRNKPAKNRNGARHDVDDEDEEESEASWQKKSLGSEDSDDFQKPVDFGIDRETSMKLDKLNVMLMVGGKEPSAGASALTGSGPQNVVLAQTLPQTANNLQKSNGLDSASSTSRNPIDSATMAHVKAVLDANQDDDLNELRKSYENELSKTDKSIDLNTTTNPKDFQNNIVLFQQSLEREFDQKRLELLENKDMRVKKMKDEIEQEINRINQTESKRLLEQQEQQLKDLRTKYERDFEAEKENLKKNYQQMFQNLQRDFEAEKQQRKEKFSMQLSKYMMNGKSIDEMDENEEKREIAIYLDNIEKKYAEKVEDRKKEIQTKYDKKLKDLEDELKHLYEQEAEKKENEIRFMKEKNAKIENYERELEKLLSEKLKEFRERENEQLNRMKDDYEIKAKAYKEKYKQLEENEFTYYESEYNKTKERLQIEYNSKISALENKLKSKQDLLDKQEENLKKRLEIIQERKKNFDLEWNKLNEEERKLADKKETVLERQALMNAQNGMSSTAVSQTIAPLSTASNSNHHHHHHHHKQDDEGEIKLKYEIEKLKLEKTDLETKLLGMQKLIEKINENLNERDGGKGDRISDANAASEFHDSDKLIAKINDVNNKLILKEFFIGSPDETGTDDITNVESAATATSKRKERQRDDDYDEDDEDDDDDIKDLVKQAKLKLRLKYYEAKKKAQLDLMSSKQHGGQVNMSSDSDAEASPAAAASNHGSISMYNYNDLTESKKILVDNLNKEKDALDIANELLEKYKHSLIKRKLKLDCEQTELRNDELALSKLKSADKLKQQHLLEDRKLIVEKEALDLEQLNLNIKTAKRLLKQKKVHLKLLENGILANPNTQQTTANPQPAVVPTGSHASDQVHSSISINLNYKTQIDQANESMDDNPSDDDDDEDETSSSSTTSTPTAINRHQLQAQVEKLGADSGGNISFKNSSNLNTILNKLKQSDPGMDKLKPILKKLPKLNNRLEITFENMKQPVHALQKSASNGGGPKNLGDNLKTINDKWNKYLNTSKTPSTSVDNLIDAQKSFDLASKINFFQNISSSSGGVGAVKNLNNATVASVSAVAAAATAAQTMFSNQQNMSQTTNTLTNSRFYTARIINGSWEKLPAYQKLTYESGTKLLDQKWNQYLGSSTMNANNINNSTSPNLKLSKTLNLLSTSKSGTAVNAPPPPANTSFYPTDSSAPVGSMPMGNAVGVGGSTAFLNFTNAIKLPASTQQRLNQHREWIKKFKAEIDYNNNKI